MKEYRNTLWCDNSHLLVAGNQIVSRGSTRAKRYGRPGKWSRNSGNGWDTYKGNILGSFRLRYSIQTRYSVYVHLIFPFVSVYTISLFSNILFSVCRSSPPAPDYYCKYLFCVRAVYQLSHLSEQRNLKQNKENVYMIFSRLPVT